MRITYDNHVWYASQTTRREIAINLKLYQSRTDVFRQILPTYQLESWNILQFSLYQIENWCFITNSSDISVWNILQFSSSDLLSIENSCFITNFPNISVWNNDILQFSSSDCRKILKYLKTQVLTADPSWNISELWLPIHPSWNISRWENISNESVYVDSEHSDVDTLANVEDNLLIRQFTNNILFFVLVRSRNGNVDVWQS